MRHYHGTPIGGTAAQADEFCVRRHLLIPWKRPDDLRRAMDFCTGFMVDNSAFSFWGTGETPEWSEYMSWVRSLARHPRFDFAIIPDVVDGSEKDNDDLIARWDKQMWHPVYVDACPVWHMHESMERLDRLCRHFRRVAIGSSGEFATPGTEAWWSRMHDAFGVIADDNGFPRSRVHGLRMLRRDIVERLPFYSCDSTNAVQNGAREAKKNGVDAAWGRATVARRIENTVSASTYIAPSDCQFQLFDAERELMG